MGLALNRSLATQLTNTGGLNVVEADIVAQFKAKRLPVLQVGSQLKADHLITGTMETTRTRDVSPPESFV